MNTKLVIAALVGASALLGGVALAQMQGQSQGQDMSSMHEQMRQMHSQMMQGGMQGNMHGGGMMHGGGSHGGSQNATAPKGDQSPSSLAFAGVNAKMHEGMDVTYSGNADRDFVQGMIPHHQGAVDMAKVVLAFGKDPEVRKLAENVIKAQEEEIAWMKSWLQKNASK